MHTDTYRYSHTDAHKHTEILTCTDTYGDTHIHRNTHSYRDINIQTHIDTQIEIHTDTHSEIHTDRHTQHREKHAYADTRIHTEIYTDTHTGRHRHTHMLKTGQAPSSPLIRRRVKPQNVLTNRESLGSGIALGGSGKCEIPATDLVMGPFRNYRPVILFLG